MHNSTVSTDNAPCFEYRWIEDAERVERYRPGGYHPTVIGDELAGRYRIVHKLGYGSFSTIWLARDSQRATYVAIKISTANAPPREAEILNALSRNSCHTPGRATIPVVQDQFEVHGPNGTHRCYVTAPAQSSVAAAKFSDLFPIETSRVLVAQLILAVAYTHGRGFVHADLHLGNALIRPPKNFDELSTEQLYEKFGEPRTVDLVRVDGKPLSPNAPPHAVIPVWLGKHANVLPPHEARLLLSDFGEAFAPSAETRRSDECRAPITVLPPESIFDPGRPLSFSADIWALACAVWSVIAIRPLFDGTLATVDDIASQQVDLLGFSSVPAEWWDRWEARHKYFSESGQPTRRSVFSSLESMLEEDVQETRRHDRMAEFGVDEVKAILDMLRAMLVLRPEKRATAEELLKSEWMVKWALPDLKCQLGSF